MMVRFDRLRSASKISVVISINFETAQILIPTLEAASSQGIYATAALIYLYVIRKIIPKGKGPYQTHAATTSKHQA